MRNVRDFWHIGINRQEAASVALSPPDVRVHVGAPRGAVKERYIAEPAPELQPVCARWPPGAPSRAPLGFASVEENPGIEPGRAPCASRTPRCELSIVVHPVLTEEVRCEAFSCQGGTDERAKNAPPESTQSSRNSWYRRCWLPGPAAGRAFATVPGRDEQGPSAVDRNAFAERPRGAGRSSSQAPASPYRTNHAVTAPQIEVLRRQA